MKRIFKILLKAVFKHVMEQEMGGRKYMEQARFRHEYKYPITCGQIVMEQARLKGVMNQDVHAGERGYYNIRSLYFDDMGNGCYLDNENGVDNREKFRIRIYNHSTERINLEVKQKRRGKTCKRCCLISLSQCRQLMEGKIPGDIRADQQALHKLAYLMAVRLMRPVVIVDYDRFPYTYRSEDANVRVTFDCNLMSAGDITTFLDEKIQGRGVMPVGRALMEVKFDSFLPDEIYTLLHLDGLTASTFSKYYLCRKFHNL